ncbi:hypothetical protein [Alteromonas genovensis]|uniref:hypothetical protein n=1 Tax=Alteromonas genovensis TaxID=471225 RepID=UPI002FDFDD68
MNKKNFFAFVLSAIAGFGIWHFSYDLTGHIEAFDSFPYYLISLAVVGALAHFSPSFSYLGVVSGQLVTFIGESSALMIVGILSVFVLSLLTPLSALFFRLAVREYKRS